MTEDKIIKNLKNNLTSEVNIIDVKQYFSKSPFIKKELVYRIQSDDHLTDNVYEKDTSNLLKDEKIVFSKKSIIPKKSFNKISTKLRRVEKGSTANYYCVNPSSILNVSNTFYDLFSKDGKIGYSYTFYSDRYMSIPKLDLTKTVFGKIMESCRVSSDYLPGKYYKTQDRNAFYISLMSSKDAVLDILDSSMLKNFDEFMFYNVYETTQDHCLTFLANLGNTKKNNRNLFNNFLNSYGGTDNRLPDSSIVSNFRGFFEGFLRSSSEGSDIRPFIGIIEDPTLIKVGNNKSDLTYLKSIFSIFPANPSIKLVTDEVITSYLDDFKEKLTTDDLSMLTGLVGDKDSHDLLWNLINSCNFNESRNILTTFFVNNSEYIEELMKNRSSSSVESKLLIKEMALRRIAGIRYRYGEEYNRELLKFIVKNCKSDDDLSVIRNNTGTSVENLIMNLISLDSSKVQIKLSIN